MSHKVTERDLRRAIRALDEAPVPLENRVIYCGYCNEFHSRQNPPPENCGLRRKLDE